MKLPSSRAAMCFFSSLFGKSLFRQRTFGKKWAEACAVSDSGFFSSHAAATGHRHHMDKPFRRAVIQAGPDPAQMSPHVMRHRAITNLVTSGADLPTIPRISGHKTLTTVLRYTHVHGRHIDQAIKAIGRGLPERVENKTADTTTPKLHTVPKLTG